MLSSLKGIPKRDIILFVKEEDDVIPVYVYTLEANWIKGKKGEKKVTPNPSFVPSVLSYVCLPSVCACCVCGPSC